MAEWQKCERTDTHRGSRQDGIRKQRQSGCAQETGGITAGACKEGKCCHGRQGYRDMCAARCECEGLSDCCQPCEAVRRYEELKAKGQECDLDVIEKDIIDRDYQDMHRELSPLKQAEDAVLVDSSDLSIEQVADIIIQLCDKGAK